MISGAHRCEGTYSRARSRDHCRGTGIRGGRSGAQPCKLLSVLSLALRPRHQRIGLRLRSGNPPQWIGAMVQGSSRRRFARRSTAPNAVRGPAPRIYVRTLAEAALHGQLARGKKSLILVESRVRRRWRATRGWDRHGGLPFHQARVSRSDRTWPRNSCRARNTASCLNLNAGTGNPCRRTSKVIQIDAPARLRTSAAPRPHADAVRIHVRTAVFLSEHRSLLQSIGSPSGTDR